MFIFILFCDILSYSRWQIASFVQCILSFCVQERIDYKLTCTVTSVLLNVFSYEILTQQPRNSY